MWHPRIHDGVPGFVFNALIDGTIVGITGHYGRYEHVNPGIRRPSATNLMQSYFPCANYKN